MAKALPNAEPGIDAETLFGKVNFKPHSEAQKDYVMSNARFNIPCCGRRWGKSIATGHRATVKSFIPNSYTWLVGPTYKLGEKEFRVVWQDYQDLNLLPYCRKSYAPNQGNMRIQTPWGSVVEVVSADRPDSLLGEGLSHAVMCEAAKHSRATWEQFIEPALSDLRGSCDFPSTPQGYNWYHGLWSLGQLGQLQNMSPAIADRSGVSQYMSWQFPTWTNTMRYPNGLEDDEIQRIKATVSSSYFAQEYGAEFTSMSGTIYEEWDPRIHIQPHTYRPDWPNYLAFDYGYVNPFVCLDIQVSPSDEVYVWREYYVTHLSTTEHGYALARRVNPPDYRVDGMWGDPRGADETATLAIMLGNVAGPHVGWKLAVEETKRLLKPDDAGHSRIHVDPSCQNLIRQMSQLRVKEQSRNAKLDLQEHTADGNIQNKVDDHAADALRYFIGPYFVLGAGSHLADIYGENYVGSESHDFLTLHGGSPFVIDTHDYFNLSRLR